MDWKEIGLKPTPFFEETEHEFACFAAGCFWGVEEVFRQTAGVLATAVGYAGGQTNSPTYKQVCTGKTGHAEVVLMTYSKKALSYEQLVQKFWEIHNPTTLNRQGPDQGTQYRSAIFFFSERQQEIAEKSKKHLDQLKKWPNPIVTQIEPFQKFWIAEDYHQQYSEKQGGGHCHF